MTEAEWSGRAHPLEMVRFARTRLSERKLRLLYTAIVRTVQQLLSDDRSRHSLNVAEDYADGKASEGVRIAAFLAAKEAVRDAETRLAQAALDCRAEGIAIWLAQVPTIPLLEDVPADEVMSGISAIATITGEQSRSSHANRIRKLISDVAGDPFRAVAFDPGWRTTDVTELARAIYDDRAFDRMPILADALMDAGCADERVLGHCRGPGPHVRGCWLVDLVLGKE